MGRFEGLVGCSKDGLQYLQSSLQLRPIHGHGLLSLTSAVMHYYYYCRDSDVEKVVVVRPLAHPPRLYGRMRKDTRYSADKLGSVRNVESRVVRRAESILRELRPVADDVVVQEMSFQNNIQEVTLKLKRAIGICCATFADCAIQRLSTISPPAH